MTWDTSTPAGNEARSNGDNRIREFKTDVASALNSEGVFPVDTASPKYKWTGKRGNTASRPASPSTGEIYFNTQLFEMEYWSGSAWTVYDLVPAAAIDATKLASSVAGNGLAGGAGTALSVNVDASTIEINADTLRVKAAGITSNEIAASVAGNGLAGGAGSALSVNVDASTIEINADTLRVKAAGVTESHLAASIAGNGLSGGAGTPLAVNVDASTVEINTDTLRVKAGGITESHLATSVAGNGLAGGAGTPLAVNVDASTIEISTDTLRVKDLGITNAKINDVAATKITGQITTAQITDSNVTTAKINALAVTDAKVNDVASTKITGQITTAQITALAVTDAKINDVAATKITGTVSNSQIASMAATKLTGTTAVANGGTGVTTKIYVSITYTGNGANRSIAHGMGVTPDFIIFMSLESSTALCMCWSSGLSTYLGSNYTRFFEGSLATGEITSVDATNVNLTASPAFNYSGGHYQMFCWKSQ